MPLQWAIVFFAWGGALLLAAIPNLRQATLANIAVSAGTFLLALMLAAQPFAEHGWTRVDALNLPFILISGFVGLTTAVFSAATLDQEGFDHWRIRAYHAAYQVFMGAQTLALLADNLGVMWVAIEIATLATVSMVAVHRTPAAFEAAWKFFILCGVGIALALFGMILLAMAAQGQLPHEDLLSFAALKGAAGQADAGLLSLAFVFLLVGFGTKAGLAPLHSWLPDAHAEGPTAIAAVLSGLLLNAAMLGILRGAAILGANPAALPTGPFLMAAGLLSLWLAALSLWRRRDAKRFLGWSSIEHMGLAAFAFGLGGPAGALAGMLHLCGHALLKPAAFFAIGRAAQLRASQAMGDIGGMARTHPALGWGLALAMAGLAGLPPFALLASEFLMAATAGRQAPWLLAAFLPGLFVAALAVLAAMQRLCFGPSTLPAQPAGAATLGPLWAQLALAAVLGLALPAPLAALLRDAAAVLP